MSYSDGSNREGDLPSIKLTAMQYAIVAVLLILMSGLWRLQVLGTDNYRALADANRIRKVPILAPRGKLLDREGRIIVDNYPSVSCFLIREQGRDLESDLPLIARGLNLTVDQLHSILKHYRGAPIYQPLPLKEDITPDEQAFIEAHRNELPELETIDEQRRLYPRDGFAAHLIGYVGEVSEEMLDDPRYAAYEPGDVVGKSGVEQTYDQILRGTDGSRDVLVDSHGREVGRLGSEHAIPGKSLRLTIDLDIQRAAENAMGERPGAMVAMDPHTGEILAMVSRPTFDPNAFSVRIGRDDWNRLMTDPHHPLLNKTIQAQLAPGSTFKIVMSVAGLQENVAQTMHVMCPGGASFFGHFYKCDKKHGMVDIEHAIPWSCDTFFYTLANRLGIETIAKYGHELGLGQRTGIDLPNEVSGIMPSEEWKMKTQHEKWYAGETISVGIGQGAITVTPLQLARMIAGVTSGGALVRPHVVVPDDLPAEYKNAVYENFPGSAAALAPIQADNWQIITDGMAAATDPKADGTAAASHLDGIDFAGKTGTAQVISHEGLAKGVKSHSTQPNSWFVGVTPRRNPDIVVAVLWENGDWGSNSARLGAQVVAAYVEKQRRLNNNLQEANTPQPPPTEVSAIWSSPAPGSGGRDMAPRDVMHSGRFLVDSKGAPVQSAGGAPVQSAGTTQAASPIAPLKKSSARTGNAPAAAMLP